MLLAPSFRARATHALDASISAPDEKQVPTREGMPVHALRLHSVLGWQSHMHSLPTRPGDQSNGGGVYRRERQVGLVQAFVRVSR